MSRFNVPPHPRPFSLMEKGVTTDEVSRGNGVTVEARVCSSPSPLRERAGVRANITKQLSKNLRKNQTDAEIKMWRHLKNRNLAGFKFRRQCPIGPYIVDFVCLEKMLIVEIDGGQHAIQIQKDARRTKNLEMRGFSVMRFWNNEVLAGMDSVLNAILMSLVSSPSSPTLLPRGEGSKATDESYSEPVLSLEGAGRMRGRL